jgi:hypothetical protein
MLLFFGYGSVAVNERYLLPSPESALSADLAAGVF